jgi:cell fate (sporulation/competence/biofilm development) regulator YlbF (YheA/YmcA/DUF963 family)
MFIISFYIIFFISQGDFRVLCVFLNIYPKREIEKRILENYCIFRQIILTRGKMSIFKKNRKLYELLAEFYECLADMEQFRRAQQSINLFLANDEARKHYEKLLDLEEILHSKQKDGGITEEDLGNYRTINEKLQDIPGASEFFAAQDELESIHLQIMNFIGVAIETGQTPSPDELEEYNKLYHKDDAPLNDED